MRIGILSYRSASRRAAPEELRLQKEARLSGHTSRIFRANKFMMVYDGHSPWLYYDGKPFPHYDVMISRPSVLKDVDLYASVIEQMQMMGTLVFNRYESIVNAKNKLKTTQILDHYGIPVPQTVIVRRSDDLKGAVKILGGFPVILKQPVGSYGNGVTIIESMRALKSVIVWDQPLYLLQKFSRRTPAPFRSPERKRSRNRAGNSSASNSMAIFSNALISSAAELSAISDSPE